MVRNNIALYGDVIFAVELTSRLLDLREISRGYLDHFSRLERFEGRFRVGIETLSPDNFEPSFRVELSTFDAGVEELSNLI
jgi:hypothetical protein